MVRIRQLQAIELVLKSRTLTAAAELFGITQPAMSRLIAQLEEDVGFPILTRTNGRINLTPRGTLFWRDAERVLSAMRQMHAHVDELREQVEPVVRILSLPGLIDRLVSKPTAVFAAAHPGIRLLIEALGRQKLEQAIEQEDFDIALAILPIKVPRHMDVAALSTLTANCVLPKGHPLAAAGEITAKDLRGLPFLSLRNGSVLREKIDAYFEKLGIPREISVECQSQEIICEMVAAGAGVSIVLPTSGPRRYEIETRSFLPSITVEFVMMRPLNRSGNKAAEALATMLISEAAAMRDGMY